MLNVGTVIALIKSMQPEIDPTVIESAVSDWLDAHPEATTTVQDGSITEAKLATALAAKVASISSLSDEIDNIVVINQSVNLYDETYSEQGLLESNGTVSAAGGNAYYITSGFIEVEENTNYTISTWDTLGQAATGRIRTVLYDSGKQMISGTYTNEASISSKTISNSNAKYLRFSYYRTNKAMLAKGTYHDAYTPYFYKKELGPEINLGTAQTEQIPVIASELNGKKWAVCGDSFTAGSESGTFDSGMYAGKSKVYPYFIGNRTGINVLDMFFASGRTLAYPAEPGTFVNALTNPNANWYYQNIPADADYITIYLGINDAHHASSGSAGDGEDNTGIIPIGTVNDTTTATYLGAYNVVLTWLITNRPHAHIGIIVTNGNADHDEYRQGQIAIAKKYGLPYLDLNGDSRTSAMLRTSNPDIANAVKVALIQKWSVNPATNQHPNDYAHEFESHFIEEWLKSI